MTRADAVQATLEGAGADGTVVAGTELQVGVQLRDRFGNDTSTGSEGVAVVAVGPSLLPFKEEGASHFRCALC